MGVSGLPIADRPAAAGPRGEMARLPSAMDGPRAHRATMEQRITDTLTLRLGAMILGGIAVPGGLDTFS